MDNLNVNTYRFSYEYIEKQFYIHLRNIYKYTTGYLVSYQDKYYAYLSLSPNHKLYLEDIQTINSNLSLELNYDLLTKDKNRYLGYKYKILDEDRMIKDLDELNNILFK